MMVTMMPPVTVIMAASTAGSKDFFLSPDIRTSISPRILNILRHIHFIFKSHVVNPKDEQSDDQFCPSDIHSGPLSRPSSSFFRQAQIPIHRHTRIPKL